MQNARFKRRKRKPDCIAERERAAFAAFGVGQYRCERGHGKPFVRAAGAVERKGVFLRGRTRVTKRDYTLVCVKAAEAVDLKERRLSAEKHRARKQIQVFARKVYNGVADAPLVFVHHAEAVIKLPELSTPCRVGKKVLPELVVGHFYFCLVAVNRIVVIQIRRRKAEAAVTVKVVVHIVAVGQRLILLRRGELFSVRPFVNKADIRAVLHPDGVHPLQKPRTRRSVAGEIDEKVFV